MKGSYCVTHANPHSETFISLSNLIKTLSFSEVLFVVLCNTCCFVDLDCYISRHLMSEQSHLLCLTMLMCLCVVCLLLQGFVSKLDEFICWLRDALETTDNWTPPRADIDSLKLYLETHLVSKCLISLSVC